MLRSLAARLRRLEAQTLGTEEALGQGLSGVLAYACTHHIEAVPLVALTHAELGAQIADLTAQVAAGALGLTPLLLEALEKERARATLQRLEGRAQSLPTLIANYRFNLSTQGIYGRALQDAAAVLGSAQYTVRTKQQELGDLEAELVALRGEGAGNA